MTSPQRLPASLTPLDMALDALLKGMEPAAPVELPLNEALRCIAAELPPLEAQPPRDIAAVRRMNLQFSESHVDRRGVAVRGIRDHDPQVPGLRRT